MNMRYTLCIVTIGILCILPSSCNKEGEERRGNAESRFTLLNASHTGLQFSNTLTPTKDLNIFHYMYFYNGGGIGVADYNQDGLDDVFFTANKSDNALFLNTGGLRFKEVTREAGLSGHTGWTTGVCAVDINQDGLMDIYINKLGEFRNVKGRNQLFICENIDAEGIPHFREEAAKYGLDLVGFGTQASFFDYDKDGDLDMFQLNHSVHNNGTFGQRAAFAGTEHPLAGDRLFRNDNARFIDVSATSGILSTAIGYGLGVSTSDLNLDGWPDLYVCNDFHENDYLYINQRNGTFREVLTEQIHHTSRYSMGVDIADVNNDGYNEIFTLDMLPYDPHILKRSMSEDAYGTYQFKLSYGYNYQYARNNLQLNNGNSTFSEIGLLAGIYATDWSWAALFFDFDHDGYKDLFVSNGIPKRMNDIDFMNFMSGEELRGLQTEHIGQAELALEENLPAIKLPNKFFLNTGHLTFEEISSAGEIPGFSNGAAYGDFDNDGDLDVIVNNINETPSLYQNLTIESSSEKHDYLHLKLTGAERNRQAIGAKVVVYRGEERLVKEQFPVTGYLSNVAYGIHLGLGNLEHVDSMHLIWPDGTYQQISASQCNQITRVDWKPGLPVYRYEHFVRKKAGGLAVRDVTDVSGIDFIHEENTFVEFDRETLIPHMTSTEGPALAVGDVNGDGREDVFIGAARDQQNALFLQQASGSFVRLRQDALEKDSLFEDVDAVFVDVDSDRDLDLIIASGGNEFTAPAEALKQRMYRNNGKGEFSRDTSAFAGIYLTASCIATADVEGDGDVDVFIGGRAEPGSYGVIPRSFLLENDGTGTFTDITDRMHDVLKYPGMVRDAVWQDMDGDNRPDLVITPEWSPIQIYYNRGGKMQREELAGSNGFWNVIEPSDLDGDGDMDFVAGNLGLNSKLKASVEQPLKLYVSDFDQNGRLDQLLTSVMQGREVLFPTYAEIMQQIPIVGKKFLFAKDFADASVEDLVGEESYRNTSIYVINQLQTCWFENTGTGTFVVHPLSVQMQFAPIRAIEVDDFDRDGTMDIMAMGNFFESNIEMGRYDADYGNILFDGSQEKAKRLLQGLNISGQVRNLRRVKAGSNMYYVLAKNNAPVQVIQLEMTVDSEMQ